MLKQKDLLGIKDLEREDIEQILARAKLFKEILLKGAKKLPHLKGRAVTTLFYENSTRTRTSFELAAKFLSASTANISVSTSSAQKGETLFDTGKTLESLENDFIIIRHNMSGAAAHLAASVNCCVVNGGDGTNEHPTQALLDLYTIKERYGENIKGLKIVIAGDILHSRVAKSNIYALSKYGVDICVFAPPTLIPLGIEKLGVKVLNKTDALKSADIVMGLRIQKERQESGLFPSISEYSKFFAITSDDIEKFCPNAMILHPGPVNRGVELTSSVIDSQNSRITEQVRNGLAVRMAVLTLLKGGVR